MNTNSTSFDDMDFDQETIIGPDSKMSGQIHTEGDVRVFGSFEGSIICRELFVEAPGSVKGEFDSETISFAGKITGKMLANNLLASSTSTLEGEATVLSAGMEPGASFSELLIQTPKNLETDTRSRMREAQRTTSPAQAKATEDA